MRNLSTAGRLLLLLVGIALACVLLYGVSITVRVIAQQFLVQPDKPGEFAKHRIVKIDDKLEQTGAPSDTFVAYDGHYPVAAQGKIFFLGAVGPPQDKKLAVLALDASSGTLLWQIDKPSYSLYRVFTNSATLYLITQGRAAILAYDLHTGQALWSTEMPWLARHFSHLEIADQLIYAIANDTYYLIRADTGEIIYSSKEKPTETTLQTLEPQLSPFTSSASISPDYFEARARVLGQDVLLMPNGVVKNRQTGAEMWNINDFPSPSISNIEATEKVVYRLTLDGRLLGQDLRTGEVITEVKFEPSPFETFDPKRAVQYYVAVDKDLGVLYVYLGDSQQLFAFKIVDYPGVTGQIK